MHEKIKRAFNRAHRYYDQHCQLQIAVGKRLIQSLKKIPLYQPRIMDVGCGTGLVTQQLLQALPYQQLYALDIADQLLKCAKERLPQTNVTFLEADFDLLPSLPHPVDLVFSNMALHWSPDLHTTLTSIHSIQAQNSWLAFSIPINGSLIEWRDHIALNSFPSSALIKTQLRQCGYQLHIHTIAQKRLTFPHPLAALQSIKQTGANHVLHRSHRTLRGPSFLNHLTVTHLTYLIAYFVAIRLPDRT